MAFQILINIAIAFIWMLLRDEANVLEFGIGYVVGLFILYFLRRFLKFRFYFARVIALVKLILLFIYKLIEANIDVIRIILRPKLNIEPGIIAVPTRLETEWEVTLLSTLISLTPGTLSMYFSPDAKTIYVHAIHVPDKDKAIDEIQNSFEKAILEVTK
ncbi:Na+/H+ antiporter subunit E [Alteribacter natronophilus]|uniref:Na+/H+ antiporter subunit E n=1 Tax=Alteribacter natronophilus TaxID=2583810 RepID=UPI00110D5F50|nr:Na+/H+ antiporter subunit E [Alteribacter natronophilus]TMW73895.1 Na+/H+ antiporter subunit E [Alteribacter natronophilus]